MTYNVLSPPLASPTQHVGSDPKDLDASVRLPRVLARLGEATAQGAIIGLQEVDLSWAGQLHVFFAERGYVAVFAQYGKPFNGYMGVMLAWPRDQYEVLDVEISRLSDTAPREVWPESKPSLLTPFGFVTFQGLRDILRCAPPNVFQESDAWRMARDRMNEVAIARLRHRSAPGRSFCVATYHMPCFFGSPEKVRVVNIHSLLLMARVNEFSRGDPVAIIGDFNFNPRSSSYGLFCSGGALGDIAAQWPLEVQGLDRLADGPVLLGGMSSAYREFHGQEPLFTNFALTSGSASPFVDTLDYIWMTPGQFKVLACAPLPRSREEAKGPFPNQWEPSDHLPLQVTLRLEDGVRAAAPASGVGESHGRKHKRRRPRESSPRASGTGARIRSAEA